MNKTMKQNKKKAAEVGQGGDPFLEELYDPENDDQIIEGEPVKYYDFEFEQYTINKDIIRELILDEVIMANSKEARKVNRELREAHKDGVLE